MADPTDVDRVKAKAALGELGEVTTAVESVAQALADERVLVGSFLTLYFDNETMDEADAAMVIHILSKFFGEKLEVEVVT